MSTQTILNRKKYTSTIALFLFKVLKTLTKNYFNFTDFTLKQVIFALLRVKATAEFKERD